MNSEIAYSASRDEFNFPGKNAQFFAAGIPSSDAALCAEMSRLAYCQIEPSRAFDRARILAVLRSIDFTSCDFFESDGNHCIFANNSKGLGVLAFRGTDAADPTNLGEDADAVLKPWTHGKVHTGFARAVEKIQPRIEQALEPFQGKLLFTGHSLGTVRKRRYVDCCDVVTRVPPEILGYVHLGNAHYIDSGRQVIDNPAPEFVTADRMQARRRYLIDYTWKKGTVAIRDLADRAPINYVLPLRADP